MRISDIDVMRGDASILVDPEEPYGDESNEVVMLMEVTAKERMLLKELLKVKRGECNTTLRNSNHTRKAYREAKYKRDIIHGLLDKLNRIPLPEASG